MALKKRVIELETAEADCERLKKDVQKMKKQMHEEKSRMEMDFMNQVSAISQANALKVEEIECRLKESNAVNRALNEQLEKCGGVEKKMQQMEIQQEKEIARIVDIKMKEIQDVQGELSCVSKTKNELAVRLGEAQTRVQAERKKIKELNASFLNESQADKTKIDALEAQLTHAENENTKLQKMLDDNKVEQSTIRSLEEQLSSVCKENEMLKSNFNGSGADQAKIEDQEAQLLAAQQDNKTLSRELKILSESKKEGAALSNTVRDLRDRLRSRDSELNMKIKEIGVLEAKVKQAQSHSAASMDLEKETERLKKEMHAIAASRDEKEIMICKLESECRKLKNRLESTQTDIKSEKANEKHSENSNFQRLQNEHRELCRSYAQLEMENSELRAKATQDYDNATRQRVTTGNAGKRTSKIIQQLEQNLKRESQSKQAAVLAMKNKAGGNDKSTDIKIHSLKAEVNSLKQELEWEKDTTRKLRKEVQEMKEQKVGNKPVRHSSSAIFHGPKETAESVESRTAVKGIVQSFEKKMSSNCASDVELVSMRRLMQRANDLPGLQDDLQELREELNYEREQVLELEDELTRQCEINCALLKEISNLSCENDATRKSAAHTYGMVNGQSYGEDQEEIDRLIMEVANVKSQLFNAEQSKANLEERYNILMEKHKREIDVLKEHLKHAEQATRSIGTRMEESASLDKKEIESLQKKLEASEMVLEGLQNSKSRISKLEEELSESQKFLSKQEEESRQKIRSLNFKIEALQAELTTAKDRKRSLEQDKESLIAEVFKMKSQNDELEQRSTEQQQQFDFLQKTVDDKVHEFGKLRLNDKEEIMRLREQVKSLEQELSESLEKLEHMKTTLKDKEDLESAVDELARKNVQSLHAQINKLQKQLTNKHVEVSETDTENKNKIAALEEAIDAMQMEMEEIMREKEIEIEDLKGAITDKERKALLLEKEKEQLILSMNDMMKSRRDEIDELQTELMEMSTRSANQSREVQTLKLQLEESGYRKDELQRLRARVNELGDQLSLQKDGGTGTNTTSLEIENNDLRKKLRDAIADRQMAEDKLREYVSEKDGSKQVQVLRERNAVLKHEVEKLTRKMKKLTESFQMESPRYANGGGGKSTTANADSEVEATRFVI
jgi:intraflagellar transport protein 20